MVGLVLELQQNLLFILSTHHDSGTWEDSRSAWWNPGGTRHDKLQLNWLKKVTCQEPIQHHRLTQELFSGSRWILVHVTTKPAFEICYQSWSIGAMLRFTKTFQCTIIHVSVFPTLDVCTAVWQRTCDSWMVWSFVYIRCVSVCVGVCTSNLLIFVFCIYLLVAEVLQCTIPTIYY